jgi:hypothetical protein
LSPSRSRINNGKSPHGIAGGSARARRHRDLAQTYGEALEDGDEVTSTLIRDVAAVSLELEDMQVAIVNGEPD